MHTEIETPEGGAESGIVSAGFALPQAQVTWSFLHRGGTELAGMEPYDLRQKLLQRWSDWPHLEVSARSSKGAMTLIARTAAASAWLTDHMGEVMEVVAGCAGRPIPVDPRLKSPCVSFKGRHTYYIRNLIVARARKNSPWDEWRADELSDEKREELSALIAADISKELRAWGAIGKENSVGGVILTGVGRPMPIVPSSGPRGLARIGVSFIAPWAIDGDLFAGHHTLMGHGLVKRGGEVGKPTPVAAATDASNIKQE
jgi:hypothetical protein